VALGAGALLLSPARAEARSCRVVLVPNGAKSQCLTCHTGPNGGPRNPFGLDVQAIVVGSSCQTTFWGPDLASKDSDGDGRTNGEELLDPAGAWRRGDPNPGDGGIATRPGASDPPPAVAASVEPAEAARDGTTPVSIHGTDFRATTTIRIGRYPLSTPQVVSSLLITGLAPALGVSEPGGAKDVVAIDGSTRSTLRGAIAYPALPPLAVISVEPGEVAADGTTAITVTGENFLSDTRIRIGGRDLVGPSPPSGDGKVITGTAPALQSGEAPGPRDVVASDGRGRVTLPAGVTYVEAGSSFIRGDSNGDGRVDSSDAVTTLEMLFRRGDAAGCRAAADANGDFRIDVSDAAFTLGFLFRGGASPGSPYPDCGRGGVGDLDCETSPGCS
jgi:hypothetical protein